ncbi:hypothetical protein NDA16_001481 [Ustilago loliicola]|nr:hypothetical protein NDA16_001481 [Ustilago loliicola]
MSGSEPHSKPVDEPQGKPLYEPKAKAVDKPEGKLTQTSEHQSSAQPSPVSCASTTKDPYDPAEWMSQITMPDPKLVDKLPQHLLKYDNAKRARRW